MLQKTTVSKNEKDVKIEMLIKELELTKKLLEEKDKRNKDLEKMILLLEDKSNQKMTHVTDTPPKKWYHIFRKKNK